MSRKIDAKRPTKRKATAGERLAWSIDPEGTISAALWRKKIARRIDSAIRRAVREAFWAGEHSGGCKTRGSSECYTHSEKIERKYGVKL